ncbi:2OG-Fe dioxygenase-domain-containing protein [Microdochium trichocladiopsis]|uniref:2OG-Fe dioxygenase-domain-containing protein n=1 Tax=Microdochium trichocladiopsis TaxID=1682393 RepID=A0A9P8XYT1_9PEZI|nr:2OG-Fe dioxygenase-domain-containing protein [Microdochium trichocladiopsis]KAH7025277.1 2OG-Fe dioxygenase-domain-containing protein [Microdochium trichocladiopsis]
MLSVKSQAYSPEYYKTIGRIMQWRRRYVSERCIFIHHDEMAELLRGLGAVEEDFARLQVVSEHLYADPTLPFRKSRNGRFCIDFDTKSVRRLEFQPFALSTEEDFKRYDSDKVRIFDEIEDELQLNSVLQALMAFKAIMVHGVETEHRPKMDYSGNKWVCTLFNVRTITRPDLLGEPALEGVHTDGVDHTMTTFLGSKNMAPHSAVTLLHDPSETTGISFDQVTPSKIHARAQHRHFLDTLLVTDREYKHSLSPVFPQDSTLESTRDMLVFFTRKPVTDDHISASIDSLKPHRGMPMEVPIFIPESEE